MTDPVPQIPAADYTPDHAELGITEGEWQGRGPKAQDRINQLIKQRNEEREAAIRERGQREALEKRLSMIESNLTAQRAPAAEPEKKGLEAWPDEDLLQYKSRAFAWMKRAGEKTGDDEADAAARAEAAKIDFQRLAEIDRLLADRAATKQVNGLRQELTERERATMANAHFQNQMRERYGAAVLDPNSELRREAVEQFKALAAERNITSDPHNLLAEMALERAHAKLIGDSAGRPLSALDRGRLQVEAQVRRDTAPQSQIAQLRERGDRQSVLEAKNLEIEQFWKSNFGG